MSRIVRNVVLALAFASYAWAFLSFIAEGGLEMWIVLVGVPLVLIFTLAVERAKNRNDAQSLALIRRVEPLGDYPPFVEMDDRELEEFFDALPNGAGFKTLPPKWQSAIQEAERNRATDSLALTGKGGAPSGSVGERPPDPTGPSAVAPPPRPDPTPPDSAPMLPEVSSLEPFFGEVSEEASRFWSKSHPLLLQSSPLAIVVLVSTTGIVGGVLLYEELGALVMLVMIVGSLTLAAVVAVWLSRRYEISLELPPRPPPDPRNAPDQASFRARVSLLLSLFVSPLVIYAVVIPLFVFVGSDPPIREHASLWLASAGIVLAVVVAGSVRMFRMRIDIDARGLRVINFWTTRVVPWGSVRAVRMEVPPWAGPIFAVLAVLTSAAGTQGAGDSPSGLRIFFSGSELAESDSISVSATLGCDPRRHRRYQEALATLIKQAHAHRQTPRGSSGETRETG